jgi:hypothetical protein
MGAPRIINPKTMILEQQVPNLELCKRLKELGVKQESLFYWVKNSEEYGFQLEYKPDYVHKDLGRYSAFTVAELGEVLPYEISGRLLKIAKGSIKDWHVFYEDNTLGAIIDKSLIIYDQFEDTEADACAKMLIYLLETKPLCTESA